MTSLDDISYRLGELSNGMKTLLEAGERRDQQFQRLDRRVDDVKTSIGEVKTRITPLLEDIKSMKPAVESYKRVRKNAVWAGSGIGALVLAAAGTLTEFAFRKLGGE